MITVTTCVAGRRELDRTFRHDSGPGPGAAAATELPGSSRTVRVAVHSLGWQAEYPARPTVKVTSDHRERRVSRGINAHLRVRCFTMDMGQDQIGQSASGDV
jgi:hypothetical protein